jgi:low affinity Fe/Cu permease
LIRAHEGAHNALLDLEELEDHELDRIRQTYSMLAKQARSELRKGQSDTSQADVERNGITRRVKKQPGLETVTELKTGGKRK